MTTFQLNETNLRSISHSETLLINEAQDNLKKESDKKIFKFGFGQSPFSPPNTAVESLKSYASQHDYLPTSGLPSCRRSKCSSELQRSYKTNGYRDCTRF